MGTRLVQAALDLRRRVYASLPWGYRLANLFTVLASSDTAGFGRVTYGLFLMYDVTGMPPIKGQDPALFKPETPREIERKIPPGYGAEFGKRAFNILLRRFSKYGPDFVVDVLSEGMIKILQGDKTLANSIKGKSLKDAENIFFTSLVHLGTDIERKRGKEKSTVDDEGAEVAIEDPRAWGELENHLPEKEIEEIRRELAQVSPRLAPDLPLYFDLLLDGYKDSEIIRDQMLPFLKDKPMSQQAWSKGYKEKIKQILRRHLN